MTWNNLVNPASLYLEIRPRSLRVLHGDENFVIPIERAPGGRLTPDCKENVSLGLRGFLKKKAWQPRPRALCAVDARGVSLRRLSLPGSSPEDIQRLLRLQIESEFPLPPDALAWGYSRVQPPASAANGRYDLVVAALKKELIEDYAKLFAGCGLSPVFTVAALARSRICPPTSGTFAVLDIGSDQSELITFTDGAPESIRILPWGGENITSAIAQALGISRDEAEQLKCRSDEEAGPNGEVRQEVQAAIGTALDSVASAIGAIWSGKKLYLTGRGARYKEMPRRLEEKLPSVVSCERLETKGSEATAALLGLKHAAETQSASPPLVLRIKDTRSDEALGRPGQGPWRTIMSWTAEAREIVTQPEMRKHVRLAAILCACCVCLPIVQMVVMKPLLAKKLASINAEKVRLSTIDRELAFLQYLRKTHPPYIDALTVVANSAPPGVRFDTVSMNRHGDLSLKGNMRDAQQVVDFRSKLIKSGFFTTVTVEEQTPSPDRQKMVVRVAAQWKPFGSRPLVKAEPLPAGFQPSGMPMSFPGMEGGPPPFIPGDDMPPGMPIIRGGPGVPPMRGNAPDATRKSEKSRSSSRTVTVGPNGEIIVTSPDSKSSSSDNSKDKDSNN